MRPSHYNVYSNLYTYDLFLNEIEWSHPHNLLKGRDRCISPRLRCGCSGCYASSGWRSLRCRWSCRPACTRKPPRRCHACQSCGSWCGCSSASLPSWRTFCWNKRARFDNELAQMDIFLHSMISCYSAKIVHWHVSRFSYVCSGIFVMPYVTKCIIKCCGYFIYFVTSCVYLIAI